MKSEINYSDDRKYAYFENRKYTRDDTTGFYLNSTIRKRLHRAVWESHHGRIPEDHHIHHKDFDRANNDISNLECLPSDEHWAMHGEIAKLEDHGWRRRNLTKNARPAASKWHRSREGRKWHREHYERMKDKLHTEKQFYCEQCGEAFISTKAGTRFCSNACKSAFRREAGLDDIAKTCPVCGEEFRSNKYKKQVTCSRSCANRLRARKGAAR